MLTRFIRKPEFAKEAPRLLDIYLNFRIHGKEIQAVDLQEELLLAGQDFQYSLKFARDVIQFLLGKEIPDFVKGIMVDL